MSLADLKRKLQVGTRVIMVERGDDKLNDLKEVEKVQGNSVKFKGLNGAKAGWLEFPKASLLEFDQEGFKIYEVGERDLNEEEKAIIANEPKDEEQDGVDMMSDGSTMFRRREHYYKSAGYLYLHRPEYNKKLSYNSQTKKVRDPMIKGKLSLAYLFD